MVFASEGLDHVVGSLGLAAGDGMEGVRADAVHVGFEQAGGPGEVPVAGSMADAGRVFDQFAHLSGVVALVGQGEGVLDEVRGEQELVSRRRARGSGRRIPGRPAIGV